MSGNLVPASFPLLSPELVFRSLECGDLVAETADVEYIFHDRSAQTLSEVAHRLDGSAPLSDIAPLVGLSPEKLAEVLDPLAKDDLVFDARELIEPSSVEKFLADYHRLCRFWSTEISRLPFWSVFASGHASRQMILGWGIEFYHYVESANEHMAASVSYCRTDPVLRHWFASHFVEEFNHSVIFLDGLVACGMDRTQVQHAPPLGTTRALINYLVELATTDSIAYAGAFGIMHASTASADESRTQHELHVENYSFARGLFAAVQKHGDVDRQLGHDTLVLERFLKREGRVTPEICRRIISGARGMVEHFVLFFEGIYDIYGDSNASVPRRAIDARALIR